MSKVTKATIRKIERLCAHTEALQNSRDLQKDDVYLVQESIARAKDFLLRALRFAEESKNV